MQKRVVCCPLCESLDVRSADVTDAVIVARCNTCGACITIQHGAITASAVRRDHQAPRPTIP